MSTESRSDSRATGIWYALAAFIAWGVLPLYWKALYQVAAGEILAHRIIWSFIFVAAMLISCGGWSSLREIMAKPSSRVSIFLGSLLISANWFIYIWAVNANHLVEASLGYYINPLFNIMIGVLVLRERLNFWQTIALILAFLGVMVITLQHGKIPWIALSLAITFGLYGLVKKLNKVESLSGLALETLFVVPLALGYLFLQHLGGHGSFASLSWKVTLLLMGSGIATALPLLWFTKGAKRVPLSTIGFLQYLGPTISLLIGVMVFKESFTRVHLFSFSLIWCALLLYSFSKTNFLCQMQPKYFKNNQYYKGISKALLNK